MAPPDEDTPTGPVAGPLPRLGETTGTFAPGSAVAGRYRIVRFIAEGGMGEVYEAEDRELRERVALKTIRPTIALDERAIERFKREVLLARKITHPNVCRIFDLGSHQGAEGSVTFLTMELLRGETLADRLHRAGRMTKDEALPLVGQMAAALAAAHQEGIIHRDFKSANVMLVPSREPDAPRVVVTDFGLARGGESGDVSASTTGMGLGTPAYMAPEQVEGGDITPRVDIYALGVVMYEMATGRLPFAGASPLATAAKRLGQAPAPPRSQVPGLDRVWEAVILRCLARSPADRFASADEAARALSREAVPHPPRDWRLGLAALAVLLALGTVTYRLSSRAASPVASPGPAVPARSPSRRAVAVLGFKNLTGRPSAAWLSTALAEMLGTELAAGEALRTIPGENVARMKVDLSLAESDSLAQDTLARIRSHLAADLVVLGSYTVVGEGSAGRLRLDLRVQDARAGETVAAIAESGTEAELFDLVSRCGLRLRVSVGVSEPSKADESRVRAALPASPQAARLYAEGLERLRLFDALGARERLARAAAAEPGRPLVHSALAAAWSALGYDAQAKEEARKAFDLSSDLPREERLSVEGRHRELGDDWEKAVEIYRLLWGFFPDNLEYGLRLAGAQTKSGKAKEALETLGALRRLPPPARQDPRLDIEEARAAEALSDFRREQSAAARAAATGLAWGARLLVAEARLREGWAFRELGDARRAVAACEDAQRTFAAAGDKMGVARAITFIAIVRWRQGELSQAKSLYEQALGIYRDIGSQTGESAALNNIAIVLRSQGALAEARRMYEESLAIDRKIGDKAGVAATLNNLGNVLLQAGDLAGAEIMHEEALAIRRAIGDREGEAVSLINIGDLLLAQGELGRSRKMYEDSLPICRATGDRSVAAYALFGIGSVLMAEGDLEAARLKHEEARGVREALHEKLTAAESRLALAQLSLEQGRAAEAEDAASQALKEFEAEKAVDDEALGFATLARSLFNQGRRADSEAALARALELSDSSGRREVRLSVSIAAARLRAAASGREADAAARLGRVLNEAVKGRLLGLQLEARLAQGEIEVASGSVAAGRALLAALAKEARAKGFALIARKANALAGSGSPRR